MTLEAYCADLIKRMPRLAGYTYPWEILPKMEELVGEELQALSSEYLTRDLIAIHKTARVDPSATLQGAVIIGPHSFVGPHTLLRGGVLVGSHCSIGPGCEVKHCLVGDRTAFAHFNFVGDSLIGSEVNLEAGAVTANHYNERDDKRIHALWNGVLLETGLTRFGALVGDGCKIGANAVTSPGTILSKRTVVGRLELVRQGGPGR